MPVCPGCKYEYKEGIRVCPDCKLELVDKLPEIPEKGEKTKWVPLHSQPGRIYSEMVKEVLEKKGIPCILEPGNISALAVKATSVTGDESTLWVPEKYLDEANEILNQMLDHI